MAGEPVGNAAARSFDDFARASSEPRSTPILAVDDDQDLLDLLRLGLSPRFEVSTAASGAEAIFAIRERRFDCLLIDLHMPDIQGQSVIAHAQVFFPRMAIVILSGTSNLLEEARRLGVTVALMKPLDLGEVRAVVERVCAR